MYGGMYKWLKQKGQPNLCVRHVDMNRQNGWENVRIATSGIRW
ncbi:hypothetical protein AOA13_05 [Listeria monocytogenes]|nr:hypothetical protein AOA13_05 [Listeria monocytogenes]